MTILTVLLTVFSLLLVAFVLFTIRVCILYVPAVIRIFQERPIFQPTQQEPDKSAEDVALVTDDGLQLKGSWLPSRTARSVGIIIFCHEFLSNRWSARRYCEPLREAGFDIFTFDFRNHGDSDIQPGYEPVQWVSEYELADVRAALRHVIARAAERNHKIGLFGVSRGAVAGLLAAACEPSVAAFVTDSLYSTHLVQLLYMRRWVGIYSSYSWLYPIVPSWYYAMVGLIAMRLVERRHKCRFAKLERVLGRLSPRPIFMIHGQRDNYIVPEVAERLFELAGDPKELWLVPEAKHNGAVDVAGDEYFARLERFLRQWLEREAQGGAALHAPGDDNRGKVQPLPLSLGDTVANR